MANAQTRGWGPGWPNCQGKLMRTVEVGGVRFVVRREIVPLVHGFISEIVRRGYNVDRVRDDWGYSCRAIRGTRIPSNHSWGLAIDVNATTNPYSRRLITDMPRWVIEVSAKWGFSWGGNYRQMKDAMHFEFLGTRDDVDRIIDNINKVELKPTETLVRSDWWNEVEDYGAMNPDTVTDACAVPDAPGTWRCTARGAIISAQDAPSLQGVEYVALNAPVIAIVPYSNAGAWLIGADGGIFACGDAPVIPDVYLNVIGPIVGANRDDDGALVLIGAHGHAYYYAVS